MSYRLRIVSVILQGGEGHFVLQTNYSLNIMTNTAIKLQQTLLNLTMLIFLFCRKDANKRIQSLLTSEILNKLCQM